MTPELFKRVGRCDRALSLTQPWAWMIVSLPGYWKNVENRTAGFSHKSFRGDFFVHATALCSENDYASCLAWCGAKFGPDFRKKVPLRHQISRGGIVGMARVVGLLGPGELYLEESDHASGAAWKMIDRYGFMLEDRAELPFVPCKGKLGFWTVGPLLRDEILYKCDWRQATVDKADAR